MSYLAKIQRISIYGMGLMGTSLAYSLKTNPNFKGEILGFVKSLESKKWLETQFFIDKIFTSDEEEGLKELLLSDLIVIGLPVLDSISFIRKLASLNFKGLITDMCSTRWKLEQEVRKIEKANQIRFIGSHPMCGSEEAGPKSFVKELYKNKLCILIPNMEPNQEIDRNKKDLELIFKFWEELEMKIFYMDAKTHDFILSYLSHTPHILSSILSTTIGKKKEILTKNIESPIPILGGGLRDMIRIAGSNPKMWYDIIQTNKENILFSLKEFQKELETTIHYIENDFEEWWFNWQNQAKEYRNSIYGNSKYERKYE